MAGVANLASLDAITDGRSIILNGSVASCKENSGARIYSAAKAAVRLFARYWTVDLKEHKTVVNVPGPALTDARVLRENREKDRKLRVVVDQVVTSPSLNQFVTPEEVAKAVLLLTSRDSSYITDEELYFHDGLAHIYDCNFFRFICYNERTSHCSTKILLRVWLFSIFRLRSGRVSKFCRARR